MTWRSRASSPVDEERLARLHVQLHRPARGDHRGVLDRVRRQHQQVHRPVLDRALLVQPGQQQQVLHQHAHPGRLGLDPLHDPVQVLGGQAAAAALSSAALAVVLGEAADRGQRGAQLMAGVSDEPAHPLLRLHRRRFGLLLGPERRLDLGQHRVDRLAEPADLGARVPVRDPAVQVPGRDVVGRLLDVVQRPQVGPHHGHADHAEPQHDDQADHHVQPGQIADGPVDVADLLAHDERDGLGLGLPGLKVADGDVRDLLVDHPPAAPAVLRRDRERLTGVLEH